MPDPIPEDVFAIGVGRTHLSVPWIGQSAEVLEGNSLPFVSERQQNGRS